MSRNVSDRTIRSVAVIPGRCAICNTTDPVRQFLHPPNKPVFAIFQNIMRDATMEHFYCDFCINLAEQRIAKDSRKRRRECDDQIERSTGNNAPQRTTNVTTTSAPSSLEMQSASDISLVPRMTESAINEQLGRSSESGTLNTSSGSSADTIVDSQHVAKIRRVYRNSVDKNVHDADRIARFPTAPIGKATSSSSGRLPLTSLQTRIDSDDVVPVHLRVKPSQKKRVRKQPPPARRGDVPRSPGGRPISLNEYVRQDGG